jgi:hypothetical protein
MSSNPGPDKIQVVSVPLLFITGVLALGFIGFWTVEGKFNRTVKAVGVTVVLSVATMVAVICPPVGLPAVALCLWGLYKVLVK